MNNEEKKTPEETPQVEPVEIISQIEIERVVSVAKAETLESVSSGKWKQKGNTLTMKVGGNEVGYYLKPGLIMTGLDDKGKPIFKNVFKGMR